MAVPWLYLCARARKDHISKYMQVSTRDSGMVRATHGAHLNRVHSVEEHHSGRPDKSSGPGHTSKVVPSSPVVRQHFLMSASS